MLLLSPGEDVGVPARMIRSELADDLGLPPTSAHREEFEWATTGMLYFVWLLLRRKVVFYKKLSHIFFSDQIESAARVYGRPIHVYSRLYTLGGRRYLGWQVRLQAWACPGFDFDRGWGWLDELRHLIRLVIPSKLEEKISF